MSISISMKTPNKKEIATILRAISDTIEAVTNETVTVNLDVEFT